jgi:hypothetical protein
MSNDTDRELLISGLEVRVLPGSPFIPRDLASSHKSSKKAECGEKRGDSDARTRSPAYPGAARLRYAHRRCAMMKGLVTKSVQLIARPETVKTVRFW